MTAADQIRALADTGTPAPWKFQQHPSRRDSTVLLGGDSLGVGTFVAHYLKGEADAAKIVAAVNALPKVADYDEAVMAYLNHQTVCGVGSSCPELVALWQALVVARGVLVAALGVTA